MVSFNKMSSNNTWAYPVPPPFPKDLRVSMEPRLVPCPAPACVQDEIDQILNRYSPNTNFVTVMRPPGRAIIQRGPTCGPVALAMYLGSDPEELLTLARVSGFTNQGEMFSCSAMADLTVMATKRAGLTPEVIRRVGDLCSDRTVRELKDGACMLVPYDTDFNYEPCCMRGHKAHWALLLGVACPAEDDRCSAAVVLARHGKSSHVAAWSLRDLACSNQQLVEISPHRNNDGLSYVTPPGGLAGERGLCSQYIVIK